MEIHFATVIEDGLAGKKPTNLAAFYRMKQCAAAIMPFLLGGKHHFKAVVVAGKAPGGKPV